MYQVSCTSLCPTVRPRVRTQTQHNKSSWSVFQGRLCIGELLLISSWRWKRQIPLKLHCVTFQKIVPYIVTAVRTSKLTPLILFQAPSAPVCKMASPTTEMAPSYYGPVSRRVTRRKMCLGMRAEYYDTPSDYRYSPEGVLLMYVRMFE
jgi:hypothetical protein